MKITIPGLDAVREFKKQEERKMKKRIVVPISAFIIMFAMLSVGIAYAIEHNSGTDISDNDTEDVYAVLSPAEDVMFSGVFDKKITYNTHINYENGVRTVQYYLIESQTTQITVGSETKTVIATGPVIFHLEQFGEIDDFNLFMQKTTGTMNGTYYVGLATSEDNITYSEMQYQTFVPGGTTFSSIDADNEYLKVMLFIDTSFHTAGASSTVVPLTDVGFLFRADIQE